MSSHLIQESCPDVSRTIVRIIAELASEYNKMLVPNRQESPDFFDKNFDFCDFSELDISDFNCKWEL